MSTKRPILYTFAGLVSFANTLPALAQSAECTLVLPGAASEYGIVTGGGRTYIRRNDNPTALTRLADGVSVCFRALSFVAQGGKFVPQFTLDRPPPLIEADPVQRVTIEYASGRKEVVGR